MDDPREKEFFVGYLSMPPGLTGFYKVVIPCLLIVGLAVAFWVSTGQTSVGDGTWDLSEKKTHQGILALEPYPVLHTVQDGRLRSILVVFSGKRGIEALAARHAGKAVAISGYPISRGDWEMLEIDSDSDVQRLDTVAADVQIPEPKTLGRVTLAGEIVDSKCFLGVMKPGAGKVHRACAELCILGGLPPMLVAEDKTGRRGAYLLTGPDGTSAARAVRGKVAVPVTLAGELIRRGDLRYIRMDAATLN